MPNSPIRFLLVDDIVENLTALEALLRRDGLEIHTARSAAEALELMLVNDYALAFLDVQMPETDGYELAELMRGAERTRQIPIIFVTAAERNENRRFRGYEVGAVDYIFKPIDPVVLKTKAEVFFRIARQAKELERQRDELRQIARGRDRAIASLRAHSDNSPLALVKCDAGLRVLDWSQGAQRIFGLPARDMLHHRIDDQDWLPPEAVAVLRGWIEAGPDSTARHVAEITARGPDGAVIHCEAYGSVLPDPESAQVTLSVQFLDVTERHQAEQTRQLLVGELNHRIKNTLANVQAITRQTLRRAADLAAFERSFSGRLQALAQAHSILSQVTWSSATIGQVIEGQTRSGALDADHFHRSGPQVWLSPETTLRLSLSLHELGTNAAKYGALSVPGGRVDLDWRVEGETLVVLWRESGGPPVTPPRTQGFGTVLIGGGTGGAEADWRPEGVVWRMTFHDGFTYLPEADLIAAPEGPPTGRAGGIDGFRILLVEDEPIVAMDVSCELEDAGAEVVCVARTLQDAIAAASNARIDVALLDGNLGGAPVDQVADVLARRRIPFCFISGYGREHLPQAFPHVPIVRKPFDPQELLSTVGRIAGPERP
ncbi:response regulator [Paenirhodobacter populi]|uniref:histidine kinase n=1 Tax=Paenirhodobacter populi TaxID=2306993 RepID=A0A443IK27_9RHOB|nr:response regulator [Sinirhodobacter populi]RWR04846.1 response regulator [Sinirhodobacter populi]